MLHPALVCIYIIIDKGWVKQPILVIVRKLLGELVILILLRSKEHRRMPLLLLYLGHLVAISNNTDKQILYNTDEKDYK
jgi:hypothetical protein